MLSVKTHSAPRDATRTPRRATVRRGYQDTLMGEAHSSPLGPEEEQLIMDR